MTQANVGWDYFDRSSEPDWLTTAQRKIDKEIAELRQGECGTRGVFPNVLIETVSRLRSYGIEYAWTEFSRFLREETLADSDIKLVDILRILFVWMEADRKYILGFLLLLGIPTKIQLVSAHQQQRAEIDGRTYFFGDEKQKAYLITAEFRGEMQILLAMQRMVPVKSQKEDAEQERQRETVLRWDIGEGVMGSTNHKPEVSHFSWVFLPLQKQ